MIDITKMIDSIAPTANAVWVDYKTGKLKMLDATSKRGMAAVQAVVTFKDIELLQKAQLNADAVTTEEEAANQERLAALGGESVLAFDDMAVRANAALIVDWQGFGDADGNPVKFSQQLIKDMIKLDPEFKEFVEAEVKAMKAAKVESVQVVEEIKKN